MASNHELKDRAIAFYKENRVPSRMQDVLNIMFLENPTDVNGYVSEYFDQFALSPTISRLAASQALDSKGQPSIITSVFCIVKNKEQLISRSHVCVDTSLMDSARSEEREQEDTQRVNFVTKAIALINERIQDKLVTLSPRFQQEIDRIVYDFFDTEHLGQEAADAIAASLETDGALQQMQDDANKKAGKKSAGKGSGKKKGAQMAIVPDTPLEKPICGWHAVTAISQAVCLSGAQLNHSSVFDHLLSTFGCDDSPIRLPLPLIALIQSGKSAIGKNKCVKEYLITPRPDMAMTEVLKYATKMQEHLLKVLLVKNGIAIKNLNDIGALCPVLDKPEQGLDMITEAAIQAGVEMGKDFFFVLNIAAQEFFDYEKGKYEVTAGVVKAPDDMADFWLDLTNRYPAVIGLIDPIRHEEKQQWNKICNAISAKCQVIADKFYKRPALLKDENLDFNDFSTTGIVMRLEAANTITHIVECAKKMRDANNIIILAAGQHETNDTLIIDLAIACQARFVKLGAPVRGERVSKYNQLLCYESDYYNRLSKWDVLQFKHLPPTPSPQTDADLSLSRPKDFS